MLKNVISAKIKSKILLKNYILNRINLQRNLKKVKQILNLYIIFAAKRERKKNSKTIIQKFIQINTRRYRSKSWVLKRKYILLNFQQVVSVSKIIKYFQYFLLTSKVKKQKVITVNQIINVL